jgi:two-component system LytT family response regulator/two-component system response regulator LytT
MIVDDEQPCLDELGFLLKKIKDVEIAGAFINPLEALQAAKHSQPDALFVDIVMPRMNGIELAEKIQALNSNIRIVFVTAHAKQFAAVNNKPAAGCLLKPLNQARLGEVMGRLQSVALSEIDDN